MVKFLYELSDDSGVFKSGYIMACDKDEAINKISGLVSGDFIISKIKEL